MNITERVDLLFRTITKPNGKEYSYREVARLGGDLVSSTAIWKVRTGRATNPSRKTIQALSDAFGVPVRFFFDEDVAPDDIPQYRAEYRSDKLMEQIALRARNLDEEGKRAILHMLSYVLESQRQDAEESNDEKADSQSSDAGNLG